MGYQPFVCVFRYVVLLSSKESNIYRKFCIKVAAPENRATSLTHTYTYSYAVTTTVTTMNLHCSIRILICILHNGIDSEYQNKSETCNQSIFHHWKSFDFLDFVILSAIVIGVRERIYLISLLLLCTLFALSLSLCVWDLWMCCCTIRMSMCLSVYVCVCVCYCQLS